MMRFGQVIGVREEKLDYYKKIHADDCEGVRALLTKHHYSNFNIFLTKLDDGKDYLFGYFEYTGDDYNRDNAELAADPAYAQWSIATNACQLPLHGFAGWKRMEQVFFLA